MHQNHDQISGLSVSNLFICGLKAYLVIFGSQLLNLYNNVAVCRFELLGILKRNAIRWQTGIHQGGVGANCSLKGSGIPKEEEISEEANILALKHPGMLADLKDDIPLGMSPKKNKKRRISGMSPKKNKKRRISETP